MNFSNVKVPKMPGGGAISALIKLGVVAGIGVYGVANSLYNVDGGHRAIVFNRITGVKDKLASNADLKPAQKNFSWTSFIHSIQVHRV